MGFMSLECATGREESCGLLEKSLKNSEGSRTMKRRTLIVAFVGWLAVAFGVGVWAQTAGQRVVPAQGREVLMGQPIGSVISGEDIGFQAVASAPARDGFIVGKIMVRVNGRWLEVQSPVRVTAAR